MKIKAGFVLEQVGDSFLACATGELTKHISSLIRLNSTGAFIWNVLGDDVSYNDIVDRVIAEFDVDRSIAEADVDSFLTILRENNIIDE